MSRHAMHVAAVLADCRKAFIGWAISFLFSTNRRRTASCRNRCRGSISGTVGSLQSGEAFAGRRAITIVSSLMSGCGRGHEL